MLIPRATAQKLTLKIWDQYTPEKLELINGDTLWDGEARDNLLLMLLFNVGLGHLVEILPKESRDALKVLLDTQAP